MYIISGFLFNTRAPTFHPLYWSAASVWADGLMQEQVQQRTQQMQQQQQQEHQVQQQQQQQQERQVQQQHEHQVQLPASTPGARRIDSWISALRSPTAPSVSPHRGAEALTPVETRPTSSWQLLHTTDPEEHAGAAVTALCYAAQLPGLPSGDGHAGWLLSASKGAINLWEAGRTAGGDVPLMVRRASHSSLGLRHAQLVDPGPALLCPPGYPGPHPSPPSQPNPLLHPAPCASHYLFSLPFAHAACPSPLLHPSTSDTVSHPPRVAPPSPLPACALGLRSGGWGGE